MGEFGETSDSETLAVNYQGTGVEESEVIEVKVYTYAGNIVVDTPEILKEVRVLSMNGTMVASKTMVSSETTINATTLPKGVYVVVAIPEEGNPVITKVIL